MTGTDKRFTGQQEEGTAFGLYHYGARLYSTLSGRFVSADPLVPGAGALTVNQCIDCTPKAGSAAGTRLSIGGLSSTRPLTGLTNPQALDRYSYVLNNPLRYCDPRGLCFNDPRTGEPMDCDAETAFRWVVCATSPTYCEEVSRQQGIDTSQYDYEDWMRISALASYGVGTDEFARSYAKYLSPMGYDQLEHWAGYNGDILWSYYNMLWQLGLIKDESGASGECLLTIVLTTVACTSIPVDPVAGGIGCVGGSVAIYLGCN
jgi:RHS repeat-associated protein